MEDYLQILWKLLMAVLGAVGFSILFYIKPRRLPLAALGGIITCGAYLVVQHFLGGELIPNLVGAFLGGIFSELMARLNKAPVPVFLVPCMITLVPGGLLYRTMNSFIQGAYGQAGTYGLTALAVAVGIAGGIMASSVCGMIYTQILHFVEKKKAKQRF